MTLHKRILDMLPALLVFAFVAAFGTYVAVAYVVRDPWWLHTLATHTQSSDLAGPSSDARPAAATTKPRTG